MTMQEGPNEHGESYDGGLIRWYEEEHFLLLLKVDGWQRVRRCVRTSGEGPRNLTLGEIAPIEVSTTQ